MAWTEDCKEIDVFNKFRNEFLFAKKVLKSCKTKEQAKLTDEWFNKVQFCWLEDVDNFKFKKGYGIGDSMCLSRKMITFLGEIEDEWNKLVKRTKGNIYYDRRKRTN